MFPLSDKMPLELSYYDKNRNIFLSLSPENEMSLGNQYLGIHHTIITFF